MNKLFECGPLNGFLPNTDETVGCGDISAQPNYSRNTEVSCEPAHLFGAETVGEADCFD